MQEAAEVLRHALSLDAHDRAILAEQLLASLDDLTEEEVEQLWAETSKRRRREFDAGRAKAISAAEVAERAEKLLR